MLGCASDNKKEKEGRRGGGGEKLVNGDFLTGSDTFSYAVTICFGCIVCF